MTLATAEQMAALTVPATLPGVVRMGTPVRIVDASRTFSRDHEGKVGVYLSPTGIIGLDHGRRVPGCNVGMVKDGEVESAALDGLAVDLTDATGRAHVVFAVARNFFGVPDVTRFTFQCEHEWCWSIRCKGDMHSPEEEGHLFECYEGVCKVPGLVGLDAEDPTRLPDGSRLVDALALKAVALHVLGGGR